jgi:hypothetical protein
VRRLLLTFPSPTRHYKFFYLSCPSAPSSPSETQINLRPRAILPPLRLTLPRKVRRCQPCSHIHAPTPTHCILSSAVTAPCGVWSNGWWVGPGRVGVLPTPRICGSVRPSRPVDAAASGIPPAVFRGDPAPLVDSMGFGFLVGNGLPCLLPLIRIWPGNAPLAAVLFHI